MTAICFEKLILSIVSNSVESSLQLIKEEKYAPEPSEEMPAPTIQIEEGLAKGRYAFQAENDKELSFRKVFCVY